MIQRQYRIFPALVLLLLLPATALAQDLLWKTYIDAGAKAYIEGRYSEAERRFNLARKEAESFGPQDPRLALSHYNLALAYLKQEGKLAEALKNARQALAIWEKVIWENKSRTESLQVADNLESLAAAFLNKGANDDIELLLKQAVAINTKLRPGHPTIATTIGYLAITNFLQKKYPDSIANCEQALAIYKRAGDTAGYKDIIQTFRNCAFFNKYQKNYAKAEEHLLSAIEFRQKSREPEYTDIDTLDDLANLYDVQRLYIPAEQALRRRLEITERVYGSNHLRVALALEGLAMNYMTQDKYAAAVPIAKRVLDIRERALPPEHADLAESINRLARCYYYLGEYDKAEPLYPRVISISQKAQGQSSADLAWYTKNYALLLFAQGKKAQAEPLFQKAREMFTKEKRDRDGAFSLYELGELYRRQKKYGEAESWFKEAIPLMEKVPGQNQFDIATILEKYASLLRDTGRETEAIPLEERAKGIKSNDARKP